MFKKRVFKEPEFKSELTQNTTDFWKGDFVGSCSTIVKPDFLAEEAVNAILINKQMVFLPWW